MTSFKVGDRVRYVTDKNDCYEEVWLLAGEVVGVSSIAGDPFLRVRFENRIVENMYAYRFKKEENMYEVGQVLVDPGGYDREIMEVTNNLVFFTGLSSGDDFKADSGQVGYAATPKWLAENGWKIKGKMTELTLDEIAEKFNLAPSELRIKKED